MLKKHLKNKRLISFIFLFLFIFNVVTDFKRQEVKANALAGVIGGMMLEGSGAAAAGAIVAAGPYVAAFAVICIGAGIVYNNREEIQASLLNAYNYAKSQGKNLMDYFSTDANGNVIVSSEGANLIKGSVKNYMSDSTSLNGKLGEFNFDGIVGSIGSSTTTTNITFPVEQGRYFLKFYPGVRASTYAVGYFHVNGVKVGTLNINSTAWSEGVFVCFDVLETGFNYWVETTESMLRRHVDSEAPKVVNSTEMVTEFNVVVENKANKAGSICADRLLGNSIGDTKSVSSDVSYKNPSIEADKDVSVSVPVDATWDRVIGKTYDETLDATTGDKTIPGEGEGTGIWDWLKNLLNSILDAIKSIPGAIISFLSSILDAIKAIPNAILSFFIIDWSLISEHIVYDEIFKDKFKPFYDVVYLLKNINANPQTHSGKFYMVIPKEMGGDGKEHVVLDLTVGYDYISMARSFINASIWLSFLWYIIKLFSPKLDIS